MSNLGNKEIMAQNIKRMLNHRGITMSDLARELDIPATTIFGWCKAETYPRIDRIEQMANFFGVQKSELVEDEQTVRNAKAALVQKAFADRPGMVQLFSAMENATEEELAQAVKIIEALRK